MGNTSKEASVPKTSSICPVVSIQYRTDRQTDRRTHDDSKDRASIALRGKNRSQRNKCWLATELKAVIVKRNCCHMTEPGRHMEGGKYRLSHR